GVLRPASLSPDDRLRIETHIASLVQQHPRDLSVQIATAFFAIKGPDAVKKKESLTELIRCVEQTPLDVLAPNERPNSRQRSQAAQQVALWLVARECLGTPEYRDEGQKLADRAIAAAQRQTDQNQLTSILYERGRLSLGAGDRAAAERQWS